MTDNELRMIEKHVNKYEGVWWNILSRHLDGVYICWGKNGRQWIKFLKIPK